MFIKFLAQLLLFLEDLNFLFVQALMIPEFYWNHDVIMSMNNSNKLYEFH